MTKNRLGKLRWEDMGMEIPQLRSYLASQLQVQDDKNSLAVWNHLLSLHCMANFLTVY